MKSRRGFANPEYMITLTLVLVILAVAIPPIARVREKRRALKDLVAARAAIVKEPSALAERGVRHCGKRGQALRKEGSGTA